MSTLVEPLPELAQQGDRLAPVLGARFALGWKHVLLSACAGAFFLHLNAVPLFHTDLWGHVNYGKWILQHRTLMTDDPFMPLAEGMRNIVTPWLSQVVFALAETWAGGEALSTLFSLVVLATYVLLARTYYLQTQRLGLVAIGVLLALTLGWYRHAIIRPEIFGSLCLAVLLWLIAKPSALDGSRTSTDSKTLLGLPAHWLRLYAGVPLLFVAWANLHGSFAVGLAVLGCVFAGQVLETAWKTRSFAAVAGDPHCRHWLYLTELALGACLINPYGIELLIETAQFSANPNLRDVQEWFPLELMSFKGGLLIFSWLLMLVVFRHSRRHVRPHEVLLLGLLAAATIPSERMAGWYAQVVVWVLMPHIAEIAARFWPARADDPGELLASGRISLKLTLACGVTLWIAFALSPSSAFVLDVKPRPHGNLYSPQTPLALTENLRQQPPQTLLFAPQWWGDWLAWAGPDSLRPLVTTHIHLVPHRVWRDYMLIVQGQQGWERTLDRYDIRDLVIHKQLQAPLVAAAKRSRQWKVVYEDDLSLRLNRAVATRTTAEKADDQPVEKAE